VELCVQQARGARCCIRCWTNGLWNGESILRFEGRVYAISLEAKQEDRAVHVSGAEGWPLCTAGKVMANHTGRRGRVTDQVRTTCHLLNNISREICLLSSQPPLSVSDAVVCALRCPLLVARLSVSTAPTATKPISVAIHSTTWRGPEPRCVRYACTSSLSPLRIRVAGGFGGCLAARDLVAVPVAAA
jgi:hypothetical protein